MKPSFVSQLITHLKLFSKKKERREENQKERGKKITLSTLSHFTCDHV